MRRLLPLTMALACGCLVPATDWQGASASDGNTPASAGSQDGPSGGDAATGDGPGGGAEDPAMDWLPADCSPLPPVGDDAIVVTPADNDTLDQIIGAAPAGSTIALSPGTYARGGQPRISISAPRVTVRSTTGVPEDVVLDGEAADLDQLIRIAADDTLLAEMTLQRVRGNLVFARPDGDGIARPAMYRLRLFDSGDDKLEFRAATDGSEYIDDGIIACSELGMTAAFRDAQDDCFNLGAVRVAGGARWIFRDNLVQGHWCSTPTYAVVTFDNGARDSVVVRNRLIDNYRGILFGGESPDTPRPAGDSPCGPSPSDGWGHIGGLVENNVIYVGEPMLEVVGPENPADSMLGFWRACGSAALHNTIVNDIEVFNAIEWRFEETSVTVTNNLTTAVLAPRNGAFASGLDSNATLVDTTEFVDAAALDFHLAATAAAIDAGHIVPGLFTGSDFDGNPRVGSPDLGAYERVD